MWERFSTSGLAGSYVDDLLATGVEARMDFRPRRALDPFPFRVSPVEEVDDFPRRPAEQAAWCAFRNETGDRSRLT